MSQKQKGFLSQTLVSKKEEKIVSLKERFFCNKNQINFFCQNYLTFVTKTENFFGHKKQQQQKIVKKKGEKKTFFSPQKQRTF